ncbi:hypothetical protein ASE00_01560 [Sphingomonas sp. Root710]|uniref:DUF4880 domain-containing protein n=1 Tax=Sphingomonas sp. Root710 TaxID=1736594 RepID=UPI0006F48EB2|nr:DUF4880 domain-containing protein [Sphingomonas sp. Root710]KRB85510.1 hypothetical protein ASE00_01560 [Sphingomonas sp. Root710]
MRLLDDASSAACAERDRWLAADPRNAVAYAEVEAAWERAAVLRQRLPMPDHDEYPPAATPGGGDCSQQ